MEQVVKHRAAGTPTGQRAVKWTYCPECFRVWAFKKFFCEICEDEPELKKGEGPKRG